MKKFIILLFVASLATASLAQDKPKDPKPEVKKEAVKPSEAPENVVKITDSCKYYIAENVLVGEGNTAVKLLLAEMTRMQAELNAQKQAIAKAYEIIGQITVQSNLNQGR